MLDTLDKYVLNRCSFPGRIVKVTKVNYAIRLLMLLMA